MRLLGIDPGLDGGLALVDQAGNLVLTERMPVIKANGRRVVHASTLKGLLEDMAPAYIVCERMMPTPRFGVTTAFRLGHHQGLIEGLLVSLGIPCEWVLPARWMGAMMPGSVHDKGGQRLRFDQLWPGGRSSHEGEIAAALIAEYGRRVLYPARAA